MCFPTIVYVMFGEPFALIPMYLLGLVNHVFPNHCIHHVLWAMGHQTIIFVLSWSSLSSLSSWSHSLIRSTNTTDSSNSTNSTGKTTKTKKRQNAKNIWKAGKAKKKGHQTLCTHWFGHTWITKRSINNGLCKHSPPSVTYTLVWALLAHQTVQCYGLIACGLRNVTYTMVGLRMAHQTLQILRFDYPWVTKRYIYNGAGTHCSPNATNTIVRWPMAHKTLDIKWFGGRMAHQTLQLQWFECPRLTKRYVYSGFGDAWLTKP